MDLQLYFRVIWRFRLVVMCGFVIALALAVFSHVTVGFEDGSLRAEYRESELWESRSTVLVTEKKFPLGRSTYDETLAPSSRFTELANIYAELATTDAVQRIVRRNTPFRGKVQAIALKAANGSDAPLPMLSISGISTTRGRAMTLAANASAALRRYIAAQQEQNGIPADERVLLSVIKRPGPTTTLLLNGRSKTLPIVVFLTALFAFVGLAFILENVRPLVRPLAPEVRRADEVAVRRPA